MRFFSKTAGIAVLAAGTFLVTAASAMSRQDAPVKSDGSSKLADPDEAIERMAEQQSGSSSGRLRAFSDSSVEARDAVRAQVANGPALRPFR